jgi:pyridoxine 4-dehydrogenase
MLATAKQELSMADISASQAGTIHLGNIEVNRIGLGTNRVTDTEDAHQLLRDAVSLGINFIDTAYRYAGGASEVSIGNALSPYRDGLVIATKGGLGEGASPDVLRRELEESLGRLKTDHITLYQLHRVDPKVPIEVSVGALKQFQDEGKIGYIGLSEVTVEELNAAQSVAEIVSVQNQYNVITRQHEALVDYCTDHHIIFIPWFPLGGLRGDAARVDAKLEALAKKYQASPQQIAIAWLLMRSPMILPIPGTLSLDHLKANLAAASISLSAEDYQWLTNLSE